MDNYLWRALFDLECFEMLTKEQQDEVTLSIVKNLSLLQMTQAQSKAKESYKKYDPDLTHL